MPLAANGAGEDDDAPSQPWPQYMGSANKMGPCPTTPHRWAGYGCGQQRVRAWDIDDPVINWVGSEDGGVTTYGSLILDLSANVVRSEAAQERCAAGDMFALVIDSHDGSSTPCG